MSGTLYATEKTTVPTRMYTTVCDDFLVAPAGPPVVARQNCAELASPTVVPRSITCASKGARSAVRQASVSLLESSKLVCAPSGLLKHAALFEKEGPPADEVNLIVRNETRPRSFHVCGTVLVRSITSLAVKPAPRSAAVRIAAQGSTDEVAVGATVVVAMALGVAVAVDGASLGAVADGASLGAVAEEHAASRVAIAIDEIKARALPMTSSHVPDRREWRLPGPYRRHLSKSMR
jgi:hypothetical protein